MTLSFTGNASLGEHGICSTNASGFDGRFAVILSSRRDRIAIEMYRGISERGEISSLRDL